MTASSFYVGETAIVLDEHDDLESLRIFFRVAEERGHPAPAVVVDETGQAVTHFDYDDRAGDYHPAARAGIFARKPRAEPLGLMAGTDWVRTHALHRMFTTGSPFLPDPSFSYQPYLQRDGGAPTPLAPVLYAHPPVWNTAGTAVALLEDVHEEGNFEGPFRYVLWEYEFSLGTRRLIAALEEPVRLGLLSLRYSPDDNFVLLNDWGVLRTLLIEVGTGRVAPLPVATGAIDWHPAAGPDHLIYVGPASGVGAASLHGYDLATGATSQIGMLSGDADVPLRVRELSVSWDGLRGLATASVGGTTIDLVRRGGVLLAAVFDLEGGRVEPALPLEFRVPYAQRRHDSPRWVGLRRKRAETPVTVSDALWAAGYDGRREAPDHHGPELARWWIEDAAGIRNSWVAGHAAPPHLAEAYAQLVAGAARIDEAAASSEIAAIRDLRNRLPYARPIAERIERLRDDTRSSTPSRDLLVVEPTVVSAPEPGPPAADSDLLAASLLSLAAAETPPETVTAAIALLEAAQALGASGPDGIWTVVVDETLAWLASERYLDVARSGLAADLWNHYFLEQFEEVAALVPRCPPNEEARLLIAAYEACLWLPRRTIVLGGSSGFFDADAVRSRCAHFLEDLPYEQQMRATPPARSWERRLYREVVARTTQQSAAVVNPTTLHPVFISSVREDLDVVNRLVADLKAAGVHVWRDVLDLTPGDRWQARIRQAIADGEYFIACFSSNLTSRDESYVWEELTQAIDRMRRQPHDRRWFIPVRLDDCIVPDISIGAGQTLSDIHYLDLFGDWNQAVDLLVAILLAPRPGA